MGYDLNVISEQKIQAQGNIKQFVDIRRDNDRVLAVWVGDDGPNKISPYRCAGYKPDRRNPLVGKVSQVTHCDTRRTNSGSEQVVMGVHTFDLILRRDLRIMGLPQSVDLLKTVRMYTEGQFERDGQIVPVTVDTIAQQPVISA